MNKKKKILAQLFIEALNVYGNYDAMEDAIWLISDGIGDAEDRWEKFKEVFKETFGVSYEEAKELDLF